MTAHLRAVRPSGLALVVLVIALLAVVALAGHGPLASLHAAPYHPIRPIHQGTRSVIAPPHGHARSSPLPAWIGDVLLGLLAALLAVVVGWALVAAVRAAREARRQPAREARISARSRASVPAPPPDPDPEQAAAALRDAVERSLEQVRSDPNARRAIIGAYRLMELALARAGLARRPAEGPREYLARALGGLSVTPAAPRRLTALFERARYDDRELDLALRDEAVDALLALRGEL